MKKFLASLLCLTLLVASLSACGSETPETTVGQTTAEPTSTTTESTATTEAEPEPVTLPEGLGTPTGMETADPSDAATLLPLLPSAQIGWQSSREEWDSLAMIDAENGIAYFRSGYWDHYLFYFDQTGAYTLYYAHWAHVMPEEWTLVTDEATLRLALLSVNEVLRILYPADMISLRGEVSYEILPDETDDIFGSCYAFRVTLNGKEDSTILLEKKTGLLVRRISDGKVKQELLQIEFTTPEFTNLPVDE